MEMKSDDVLRDLRAMAGAYAISEKGKWLQEFPWKSIPVNLKTLPRDVCGMYFAGKICLMNSVDALCLFPIYIHELRHRWQRVTCPILYFIGKIYRPLIEEDAVAEEDRSRAWLEGMDMARLRGFLEG